MTRRKTTADERALFEQSFAEARPLQAGALKPLPQPKRPARIVEGGSGVDGRTTERLRRGLLEPDAKLDLHGLTENAAHRSLLLFLKSAQQRRHKLVLVVTGKGKKMDADAPFDMELQERSRGVLKAAVPRWLRESEFAGLIAGTRTAHRKHGGDGALYIYLRKGR
ncbi:MAG TPA: Smr/MutS family protein [Rhizomicrobium sp.]|nr:Smr/MutS family protein [Rhizomicrobium sp.]